MPIAGYTHGYISYTPLYQSLLLLLLLLCIICSQIIKYFFVSLRIAGNLRVIIYGDVLPTLSRLILLRKLKLLYLPYLSDLPPSLALSFSTVCLSVGLLIYLLDQRTGESGEQMCLMSGRTNKIVDMLNNNTNKCNLWHCFFFLFRPQRNPPSPPVASLNRNPNPQSQTGRKAALNRPLCCPLLPHWWPHCGRPMGRTIKFIKSQSII